MLKIVIVIISLLSVCQIAICDEPTVIDIGELPQGTSKSYPFAIKNPFSKPLQIKEIQRSCGCMEVNISEKYKIVEVGEQFEGEIKIEAKALLGVEREKISSSVTILGADESHRIEIAVRGSVVPRLIAVDGVPDFKLSSPPALEQMVREFSLKSSSARLPNLTSEVLSPHCISVIDDLENGNAILHLKLLDSVRTYRPRELRVRVRSDGELVAEFPVYCTYQMDLRIIAQRKQILKKSDNSKKTFRVYLGESIRKSDSKKLRATFFWEDNLMQIPLAFESESDALSILPVEFDLSELVERMPSESHGRLELRTEDGKHHDSIDVWILD